MPQEPLATLLDRPRPVLLDGAVGTELARRGVSTSLPLWSAHALVDESGRAVLSAIHADYARAGAEVLVTNTFRTTRRALAKAGRATEWRALNRHAVACARAAAGTCLVAGGIAPLEECYDPSLVPGEAECDAEHRSQAVLLASLGVDLIFIETMNTLREAVAAVRAAAATGLETVVSLCPRPPAELLSGEPLAAAVPALVAAGGDRLRAVLLNCAAPEAMEAVYPAFAGATAPMPHGLYAHLGEPGDDGAWILPARHEPERYADWIERRLDQGARLVGGCCGTTPAHIAALRRRIAARAG